METIVSLQWCKDFLKVSGNGADTVLQRLLNSWSEKITRATNQNIISADTTLVFSGTDVVGNSEFTFPFRPVTALKSFKQRPSGSVSSADWIDVPGATYEAALNGEKRSFLYYPPGFVFGSRNYQLVLTTGYAQKDVPFTLQSICAESVDRDYYKSNEDGADGRIGVLSKSDSLSGGGSGSTTFQTDEDYWNHVLEVIDPWRIKPL